MKTRTVHVKQPIPLKRAGTEYNIDTSTPTGEALEDAIDAEFAAKGAHCVADEAWRGTKPRARPSRLPSWISRVASALWAWASSSCRRSSPPTASNPA